MRWRVFIRSLETSLRIGIHQHEREAQRLLVNAEIEGVYAIQPQGIGDCFNYDHLYKLVVHDWPKREHVELLETLVIDLLCHIFSVDERVERVTVSIAKPDIFAEAESVGVETVWTRGDYARLKGK